MVCGDFSDDFSICGKISGDFLEAGLDLGWLYLSFFTHIKVPALDLTEFVRLYELYNRRTGAGGSIRECSVIFAGTANIEV